MGRFLGGRGILGLYDASGSQSIIFREMSALLMRKRVDRDLLPKASSKVYSMRIRIHILIISYQIMHWSGLFGQKHLKLYSILPLLASRIYVCLCTSSILPVFDRVKMLHEARNYASLTPFRPTLLRSYISRSLFRCLKLTSISISDHLERIIWGCSQQGKATP